MKVKEVGSETPIGITEGIKKKPQPLTPDEIREKVKLKRLEKNQKQRPVLDINEDKLKQVLDDGAIDFSPKERAVLPEILKS